MKILRPIMVLTAVVSLSACGNLDKMDEVKALNETNAVGNAFTQKLTEEYRSYVNREMKTYDDHADALHFARKGLSAARGDMVMPEPVTDWNILPGHAGDLISARTRLVNVFSLGAREMQPDLSAYAQTRFDCWIEEQEENFQQDQISSCKAQALDAIAQLEAALPSAPAPVLEPVAAAEPFDVNPAEPMKAEDAVYIVFFDFDESSLNASALSIIDAAAQEAKTRNLNRINLTGFTDTSGSRDYNQKLSMKRGNIVRDALAQRGVDANIISVDYRGESELLVQTADDVREPANRRTQITFE